MTELKRLSITITKDLEIELKKLKKKKFYDKPYAEMIRFLIRKGIEAIN